MSTYNLSIFFIFVIFTVTSAVLLPLYHPASPPSQKRVINPAVPFASGSGWAVNLTLGGTIFSLQIDTGSSDLLVYSKECKIGCNGPKYVSTSVRVNCTQTYDLDYICDTCANESECRFCLNGSECISSTCYGDGSGLVWTPVYGQARYSTLPETTVRFGAVISTYGQNPNFTFTDVYGCSGPVGGSLFTPTLSGIWGVGLAAIANLGSPTALDSIIKNSTDPNIIALCFGSHSTGSFAVGENYVQDKRFTFYPLTSNEEYRLHFDSLAVGGQTVFSGQSSFNLSSCLADSGTTTLVFPETIFNEIYYGFLSICNQINLVGLCFQTFENSIFNSVWRLSPSDVAAYPNLVLTSTVNNLTLTIPATSYMWSDGNQYTIFISGESDLCILGAPLFYSYFVAFDRSALTLGFASITACPSYQVPQPTPPTGGTHPTPPTGGTHPTPPTGGTQPTPPTGGTQPTPPTGGTHPTAPTGSTQPTPPTGGTQPTPPTGGTQPTPPTGGTQPTPPIGGTQPTPPSGGTTSQPSGYFHFFLLLLLLQLTH